MTIRHIPASNFVVKVNARNPAKKMLYNTIRGFSMVLFYSSQCEPSRNFLPIYDSLDRRVNHILLYKMNVDTMSNRAVVDMSTRTIDEIEFTPTVIFYRNGRPLHKLEGVVGQDDLKEFFERINESIQEATRELMERGGAPSGEGDPRLYFIDPPRVALGRTPVKRTLRG